MELFAFPEGYESPRSKIPSGRVSVAVRVCLPSLLFFVESVCLNFFFSSFLSSLLYCFFSTRIRERISFRSAVRLFFSLPVSDDERNNASTRDNKNRRKTCTRCVSRCLSYIYFCALRNTDTGERWASSHYTEWFILFRKRKETRTRKIDRDTTLPYV